MKKRNPEPLRHLVELDQYWDRRSENPNQNKGISGVVQRFIVEGRIGRTVFEVNTNWYPEDVHDTFISNGILNFLRVAPKTVQHYAHSAQRSPGERAGSAWVGPVDPDGVSAAAAAEGVLAALIAGGEAMWAAIEVLHRRVFPEDEGVVTKTIIPVLPTWAGKAVATVSVAVMVLWGAIGAVRMTAINPALSREVRVVGTVKSVEYRPSGAPTIHFERGALARFGGGGVTPFEEVVLEDATDRARVATGSTVRLLLRKHGLNYDYSVDDSSAVPKVDEVYLK